MNDNVNFTGSIDRSLLRRAKVIAAKTDTSVSALLKMQLSYLVETFEAAEVRDNRNYRALFDFSMGRIDDREAMDSLGIDSEEELFLLMCNARLPMPRLPAEETQATIDGLKARRER